MDKKHVRERVKSFRKTLIKEEIVEYSNILWKTLYNLEEFKKAKVIMSYMSFKNEIDTSVINKIILDSGKILLLPRVEKDGTMNAVIYSGQFHVSSFGIEEPIGDPYFGDIDLIIVPGLAFDHFGNRVGYGKGYYDRFFTKYPNSLKIAPAYESQIFDKINNDATDVQINGLLVKNNYMITKNY